MESDIYGSFKKLIENSQYTCYKKCGVTKYPATLACIECGKPYHLGCLAPDRFDKYKYISGNLINCCINNNSSENTELEISTNELNIKYDELLQKFKHSEEKYNFCKKECEKKELTINELKANLQKLSKTEISPTQAVIADETHSHDIEMLKIKKLITF